MSDVAASVLKFITRAEQIDTTILKSSPEIQQVYLSLITEEYKEFLEAQESGNEPHTLQEALDLIWVLVGFCLSKGYDFDGAWGELTKANLAKLQINPATGRLYRKPNGKIAKPDDWKAPNFEPYVTQL